VTALSTFTKADSLELDMLTITIERPPITLTILGSGLRNGFMPPPLTAKNFDLNENEMEDFAAFEAAGWRFQAGDDEFDWGSAKNLNGNSMKPGLLARHPQGGLVIITNELAIELPPGASPFDPVHGPLHRLPFGTSLYQLTLPVPDAGLFVIIAGALEHFNQQTFDGEYVAEPVVLYNFVHPSAFVTADPRPQWHWDRIHLNPALRIASGKDIRIAVIDWGFHLNEPQIRVADSAYVDDDANIGFQTIDGAGNISYIDDNGNTLASRMPIDDHGNYCAGLAAALADGHVVNGAAPDSKLFLIRVPEIAASKHFAIAIEAAATRFLVDVISSSVGVKYGSFDELMHLKNVIDKVHDTQTGRRGTIVVWAVFNAKMEIPPASIEGYEGVICVGGCMRNDNDDPLPDGGYGKALDLLAPGDTVPGLWWKNGHPSTGSPSGSSCAAPIVAGVAALVMSANSALKWNEVTEIVLKSCDPPPADGQEKTRVSCARGFGTLNAERAIAKAAAARRASAEPESA